MKKLCVTLLFALLLAALLVLPVHADEEVLPLEISPSSRLLTDGREGAPATVSSPLEIKSEEGMSALYLIFYDTPVNFTLSDGEKTVSVEGKYLRRFVDVRTLFEKKLTQVTVTFEGNARLIEIYAYGTRVPASVQRWEEPCEKADLCLMTTHADDEQLFFAGVLPYYAGEKGYEVQVVYFTDHKNEPGRRHELLAGLWEVGVTHYPVISEFPDLYSTSLAAAENQLNVRGFTHGEIVDFQVEMLRRFKPKVVIGHDPNGEYGHGQHRLNTATLTEALDLTSDESYHPESAEKWGTWNVPKTYLHLYGEGQIEMNWDIPLEKFGGKTAFQKTQDGFSHHASQHYTWFRTWLLGNRGQITEATQITTHSPCKYGLYRSTVGSDVEKNDFFENVTTWEEDRLAEEKRRQEALTAYMQTVAQREESLREEGVFRYRQKQVERDALLQAEQESRRRLFIAAVIVGGAAVVVGIGMGLYFRFRKRNALLLPENEPDDVDNYPFGE
ncbi:MAG: PIG-L family deacetylase [Clostridia bacterium]|nr:PIG-L family deacetylase [Clostridia bacterium]